MMALKSLQKMLQKFPRRFENYAELTILKVLELHKDDTYRDVSISLKLHMTQHFCLFLLVSLQTIRSIAFNIIYDNLAFLLYHQ